MRITVNGDEAAVEGHVLGLIEARFGPGAGRGIAVAINGTVVPRSAWPDTALLDGDRVDIVTAVQGG
jgi:sulfur carrier protein